MSLSDGVGDPLLGTLLDVRSVFDPVGTFSATLREAVGAGGARDGVGWVALPDPGAGLVIEHVVGESTRELDRLVVGAGQGMTGRVYGMAAVHWVDDYAAAASISHEFDEVIAAERVRRMIAAPLAAGDDVLGVLTVGRRDDGRFGDDEIDRVGLLARQASLALEIASRNRASARAAALAERRRLSEDLHDGVGALLFSLCSRAERLQARLVDAPEAEGIAQLRQELAEVSRLVRTLVHGWHTEADADLGVQLEGMVEEFARRSGIQAVCVHMGVLPELDAARRTAVTRFVGVALSNVERHSAARHASVTLAAVPGQVTVSVSNDGPPPPRVIPGVGLGGARERIERMGGEVLAFRDGGSGFTVRARIPL